MEAFISITIIGLVTGATYAVAAGGLVVTYMTSGIFNIAHGAVGMFMAFVFWQFWVQWHLASPLSLILVVFVAAPLFGAIVERFLIRRVADGTEAVKLVVTVGLMVLLIGLVEAIWPGQFRSLPSIFGNRGVHFGGHSGGVYVTDQDFLTVGVAIAIAVGLRLFLYRSRIGVAMRAVVDNRSLAGLNGARPEWAATLSWSIGSMLAAISGILIAQQDLQLSVIPLTLLVVNAYASALVGRLRNLPITFVGALIIGLLQSYAIGYIPTTGIWDSIPIQGLHDALPAVLLFIVLLALPQETIKGAVLQARRSVVRPATFMRSIQGSVFLVVAITVISQFLDPGNLVYLGEGLALALIMLSLVPLTGWGGSVSLCQMTFAGFGAFLMSKLGTGGSVVGLVAAFGITAVLGAVIAIPALRLRGLYLALATLAFAVIMDDMFFPAGQVFSYDGEVPIPRPSLFGLHLSTERELVIFLAIVFAVVAIALVALRRGPFGRVLSAMKDSEAACATLGLNLTLSKVMVFGLSAGLAGFAGALYGAASSVAGSTDFISFQSLPILLLVVIFGVETASGALVAGVVFGLIPAVQSRYPALGGIEFLSTGLAGVVLGANPNGISPAVSGWFRNRALDAQYRRLGLELEPARG